MCTLPQDLKTFYSNHNGLLIEWKCKLDSTSFAQFRFCFCLININVEHNSIFERGHNSTSGQNTSEQSQRLDPGGQRAQQGLCRAVRVRSRGHSTSRRGSTIDISRWPNVVSTQLPPTTTSSTTTVDEIVGIGCRVGCVVEFANNRR